MIVLLSPAKTLDEEAANPALSEKDLTSPAFSKEADELVKELQKLPVAKLKSLLGVSDAIAKLNHERYKGWQKQKEFAAATLFDGPAYRELRATDLSRAEIKYAADHLRILCGLYGILRPWDLVKPYRLDMSKKLANSAGKDLYAFWAARLAEQIEQDLQTFPSKQKFVVNCASQEYFQSVVKHLTCPVYTMQFPGPSVYAKQARGAMVRYIIQTKARTPEDLKGFSGNNGEWKFCAKQSSEYQFCLSAVGAARGREGGKGRHKAETVMGSVCDRPVDAQAAQPVTTTAIRFGSAA